ncbi:MAG: hypothetical protein CVV41_11070 [Candidatus Riflebacteria bacterium HGW-Riflebacteria-1]|jgi:hypothetical protein|nr:MAG: hypothetical protein CVV41_11070 [Candidatus Riflebacteria bacterium HGW-Riflebacteria-1]
MSAKSCYALILAFVLTLPGVFACSLPAEPCAAIVPINAEANGMKLVTEGNKFFYLVPQGTSASFKVVWDPAAHNTGGGLQGDKYDWCTKARIPFEAGTDKPNGYGYFPIQSMADFFAVSGNRGSVQEAFSRQMGVSLGNGFLPSLTGPYALLSGFVKPGNQGRITTLGGQSTEYPAPGWADVAAMSDTPVTGAIDDNFPSSSWNTFVIPLSTVRPNPPTTTVFPLSATKAVRIRAEGLLMEDIDMEISRIRPEDYKAFVRTGNPGAEIEVESNPQIVWSADGSNGTPGPNFNVTFNTPSFNGDKEQSKIRLKVWSPGAGFEISNIYWAWKETVYNKKSGRVVTQEEQRDASGTIIVPERSEMRDYWEASPATYMCSEELQLTLVKSAAEAGSTDFIVYDDKSPIAADFKITSANRNFLPTGPTPFDFTLKVLDTNPYFNKIFNTTISGVTLKQSIENLDLQVYYSYPHYQYSAAAGLDMNRLKTEGYGLVDLEDLSSNEPKFKGFKHEAKWAWKKADVSNLAIGSSQPLTGGTGRKAGAVTTITGKLNINQPRPWHECNEGGGKSVPEPKFKVFAISADSAGMKIAEHDAVKTSIGTHLLSDTAKPESGADPAACHDGAPIPAGDTQGQISSGQVDDSGWSNVEFLKAKDETGPEIQVVVFDTRTNRYHMFGTKQNVAAGFSEFGGEGLVEDYSTGDMPYLGKESNISGAHQFTDLSDINGLFDKYLVGPNAVSTIADDSQTGFVCQQNNRLVFYIRAVDNINGYLAAKQFGISALSCNLVEKNGAVVIADPPSPANMLKPIEHVFRFENVDNDGAVSPEYYLEVNATDHSNNSRNFKLNIAVLGKKLDIRTLEERRKRID